MGKNTKSFPNRKTSLTSIKVSYYAKENNLLSNSLFINIKKIHRRRFISLMLYDIFNEPIN